MRRFLIALLLSVLLAACQEAPPPPDPEGPALGQIPILGTVTPMPEADLPISLAAATQVHGETVNNPRAAFFFVEADYLDMVEEYDREMKRLGWQFIDSLKFGDGGNVRRYHRGEQRAILAFEPEDGGTQFMLMQGAVK